MIWGLRPPNMCKLSWNLLLIFNLIVIELFDDPNETCSNNKNSAGTVCFHNRSNHITCLGGNVKMHYNSATNWKGDWFLNLFLNFFNLLWILNDLFTSFTLNISNFLILCPLKCSVRSVGTVCFLFVKDLSAIVHRNYV